jgi:DNA topoisomerase-1
MTPTVDTLHDLYSDTKTCAELVGLTYIDNEEVGILRQKHGKGFIYKDRRGRALTDKKLKQHIAGLVIPPAWQEVWICPRLDGHILATGIDDQGRKQYIYHPKWRATRDLIKFYRMITFAKALPKIRRSIDTSLKKPGLSHKKVMAAMLWILDNTYIRIGNDQYYQANDSIGLTTLTDRNIVIVGSVITLSFKGKSNKDQQITLENPRLAKLLDKLRQVRGERLFRYQDAAQDWHSIDSDDINKFLHELTALQISAKDFRTWGGTLIAYLHLLEEHQNDRDKKTEKVVLEAVDQAAAVLGNTRSVARSAYVHPDLLATFGSKNFQKYYATASKQRKIPGLDKHETELLYLLEQLFKDEFSLLHKTSK